MGQKRILLQLIKTMEFINKKNDPLKLCFLDNLFYFFETDTDGTQRNKRQFHIPPHKPSEGCLTYTARPPEDHGRDIFFFDEKSEYLPLTKDVVLADKVFKCLRPHPVGKRFSG